MEPSATGTPRRRAASAVEQKCSAVFLFFLIVISLMKQLQEDKEVHSFKQGVKVSLFTHKRNNGVKNVTKQPAR
jgi:hypothetical protein